MHMTRFTQRRAAPALPAQAGNDGFLQESSAQNRRQVTSRTRPHNTQHALGPRRQHRAQALVLGQWATALLGSLALAGAAQAQASQCVTPVHSFAYTGSIESYTVLSTGDYWIEAAGAEGGRPAAAISGRGAAVGGKFQLTAGTALRVLVGQQPPTSSTSVGNVGNGGGGGSFVTLTNVQPLLVAGGGEGAGSAQNASVKHGQAGLVGGTGNVDGGAGGTAGSGGAQVAGYTSGAGGGLLGDGADNNPSTTYNYIANGGKAFVNGGAGGTSSGSAPGGFGGGGAGTGTIVGGGGGYSGGGAGRAGGTIGSDGTVSGGGGIGGGGGSFNAGADAMAPLVGATDGNLGNGWVKICTTHAPAPMAITPSSLPQGVAGSAYSDTTLAVSGGWSPYTSSGLPAGMSVNASGVLTGTPAAGTAGSYTVTVSDAAQPTPHTATLSFTVLDPVSITSNAQLPDATEGSAYSATLTATGGVAPYTWALVSGSLPPGLTLTPSGEISGTVAKVAMQSGAAASGQASKAVGAFSFSVVATGSGATPLSSAPQALSLQVVAAAPATVTPVPTLGAWGLALLGVLTAGLGLRRRVR